MKYEIVLVLDAESDDLQTENEIKIVQEYLEKNCSSVNIIKWGKRKLAYPIKRRKHGEYTIFEFETDKNTVVEELERNFRINEKVLRYLSVKC
ncbi:MAG: 30S ribosomal protein S6 [bacterium]